MDHLSLVAGLQVPEDRCIVEEGQVDHVLALLEFGRVNSTNLSRLKPEGIQVDPESSARFNLRELLVTDSNDHLSGEICALSAKGGNIARFKKTLFVDVGLGVHDPDRLLGVINLCLILPLHLDGGQEVFCWVGVDLEVTKL